VTRYKLVYLARRAPGVSRQDWPRTWKSHAVFASQFPALESGIEWMRYCNRSDLVLPGLSLEHDGVAVCGGSRLEALNGTGFTADDRARIDVDERRVFDMLTPNFTFYCEEAIAREGPLGECALFRFLAPRAGMGLAAFASAWSSAEPAYANAGRIARNRPVHDPLPLFPFAGIEEYWFADRDTAHVALAATPSPFDVAYCDPAASLAILTEVCHRWPKAPKG
jgi:hypothetical protein